MGDRELDIESLVSRIEQLEHELNLRKQNIVWLKRYQDNLRQEFNTRPELQQMERLQEAVVQLSEQVAKLQQRFNQPFTNSPINADTTETKQDEDIDVSTQHIESIRAFSDEGFRVARITQLLGGYGDWLLLEAYVAEDKSQETPIRAEEFLKRYREGERNFIGINLANADLTGAKLLQVNLNKANLSNTKLKEANLIGANLSEANCVGTDLEGANLTIANLRGAGLIQSNLKSTNLTSADLSNTNLHDAEFGYNTILNRANLSGANMVGLSLTSVNFAGVNLSGANLVGVRFSYVRGKTLFLANLNGANLTSSDLRGAYLMYVDLEKANLKGANLSGANLNKAKLSGAIMPDGSTHE